VRVHRSFLAAWDKIEAVDGKGNQVRVGGRTCLLSRTGKAELKKKLRGSF
ncbi:LytTR family transcriptional regulator DNA-binding domain-containing protein, partial [Acutalibacter muris]